MISINLNESCNQNCIFCQRNKIFSDNPITTQEVKSLLEKGRNRDSNVFFIGGGEPTMRDDLVGLISYAKKQGFTNIGLESNGMKLADESYVEELIHAGLKYAFISLHSHEEEVSDIITGTPGTYSKTIMGIKNLEKNNIPVSILFTITALTYKKLPDFIFFIKNNFHIRNLSFCYIRPISNDAACRDMTPKFSDAELLIHNAIELCKKEGINCSIVSGCGMPLCYLPMHESYSCEAQIFIQQGKTSFEEESHIKDNIKVQACKACFVQELCSGVNKQYADVHGTAEIYPVFLNKSELIRSIKRQKNIMTTVSIVKCRAYDEESVKDAINKAVSLIGGIGKYVKKGSKVLIKPNLLIPANPSQAATTHPSVVLAVIELLSNVTENIWVGDLSMGKEQTEQALQQCGIVKAIEGTKAKVRNFGDEPFHARKIPHFQILDKTDFAAAAIEADVIINLPKLKTHGITFYTGAIKNIFGCIHQDERTYLHRIEDRNKFSAGVVDVFSFLKDKITLNILDAVIGMEGDEGPSHGKAKAIGVICASADAVALDAVACEIVGYKPLAIPTTKNASDRGIGEADFNYIQIIGENLDSVRDTGFKKNSLFAFINHYKDKGFFEVTNKQSACTRCGICASVCPVGAITMTPYPYIDKAKCIHCYCCHEACQYKAIILVKEK